MSAMQLRQIDPSTLLVDVNVRSDAALDKDFLASVRELGVLVPVVAVQSAEGIRVRYGHRRTLAAVETGQARIPVYVTGDDDADDAQRIVGQWAENEHRSGLSTADKSAAIEQLSLLGLSAAAIAKRTRSKRAEVDHALTVASSELAKGAVARWEFLTLDQAAAVADFEANPEVVKGLVAAAKQGEGQFEHAAQRARDERARDQARQVVVEQLTAQGVRVIERPGYDERSVRGVGELVDEHGTRLTLQAHAACPGHAAYIEDRYRGDEPTPVYVCTDWRTQRHRDASRAHGAAQPTSEAEREARREVVANNRAWMSAETVRRAWLAAFLSRKTAPKGAAAYVAGELVTGAHELRRAMEYGRDDLLLSLFGVGDRQQLAQLASMASDARAQVISLGFVLAAHEAATGKHTWRHRDDAVRRYFAFLTAHGYELSEVEQLAAAPAKRPARRARSGSETEQAG